MDIKQIIQEEVENMELNNNLLSEGLSKILYHFTHINNLISILKSNKFATSSNLGSNADSWKDKGKYFFFSTQRTKGMAGYGSRHGTVSIVLDGEKLNQKFKGFPTDYWNWSKKRSDYQNQNDYIHALKSAELEDRIVTDKPYIDNANLYINEIHVEAKNEDRDFLNQSQLNEIVNLCKNFNIPVYFYIDENNFKLQNKLKSVPIDQLNVKEKEEDSYDADSNERKIYDTKWMFKRIAPIIIAGNDLNDGYNDEKDAVDKLLNSFIEKYKIEDQSDSLIKDINDKVKNLNTSWGRMYGDDEYYSISADIHNKRGDPNPYFRELLKMLINDMKKWRTSNLKEYVQKKLKIKIGR